MPPSCRASTSRWRRLHTAACLPLPACCRSRRLLFQLPFIVFVDTAPNCCAQPGDAIELDLSRWLSAPGALAPHLPSPVHGLRPAPPQPANPPLGSPRPACRHPAVLGLLGAGTQDVRGRGAHLRATDHPQAVLQRGGEAAAGPPPPSVAWNKSEGMSRLGHRQPTLPTRSLLCRSMCGSLSRCCWRSAPLRCCGGRRRARC